MTIEAQSKRTSSNASSDASLTSLFGDKRVGEIAKRAIPTVPADASFAEVVRRLASDTSEYIVIVDEDDGRALGVVPGSHVFHDVSERGRDSLASMRALEATTLGVHFLPKHARVAEAFRRLAEDGLARCVIVVDENDRFEGLVTARDVLRAMKLTSAL
jgi:predicted transcriptional regulator